MKKRQKTPEDPAQAGNDNEYYEEQSEKKYRSQKKRKRSKTPHKQRWDDHE